MTDPPSIAGMTVSDLLAAIASTEPAPGAGVAGAVSLALGVACARKAVRITARHHPEDSLLAQTDTGLAAISDSALAHGRLDARHFAALIQAMRLPHDDTDEAAARAIAIADATAAVRSAAERLLALCDEATKRLVAVQGHADEIMSGDVSAARALIEAARAIHAANRAESDR